ncbi:MAG TPA: hypothetical protein VF062_00465 [Candidatus Limnocylindrales bacterium]
MSGPRFPFDEHITEGTGSEATAWIQDSTLEPECKAALSRFVRRFPAQTFTREDDAFLDYMESLDGVRLPPWMRRMRKTLSGFGSGGVHVRFDSLGHESPRAEYVHDIWYTWQLAAWDEELGGLLRDEVKVYTIADWRETLNSYLAIDLADPDNGQILEFSYLTLVDNMSLDEPLREVLSVAFPSYCDMISHIAAVRLPGGEVVEAEEGAG